MTRRTGIEAVRSIRDEIRSLIAEIAPHANR
jgi:hypothetical protein